MFRAYHSITGRLTLFAAMVIILAGCSGVPMSSSLAQTKVSASPSAERGPASNPPEQVDMTKTHSNPSDSSKHLSQTEPSIPANSPKNNSSSLTTSATESALPPSASAEAQTAVRISIAGDKEKGTILELTSVEIQEKDTVIDVLRRITKTMKIQMETKGSGKSVYVEGISNLYEFDKGGKSGWLYRVNGEFPNVGAGAYSVKKGDSIEWLYTLDLGKDVGKDRNMNSGVKGE